MAGDFKPRENDHLVEPMFDALREPSPENGPGPHGGRRAIPWILAVIGALLIGYWLLS